MTSSEKESQDMNTLDRHFLIWQFENFAPNILRIVTFLPNLVFMGSIKLQIKFCHNPSPSPSKSESKLSSSLSPSQESKSKSKSMSKSKV